MPTKPPKTKMSSGSAKRTEAGFLDLTGIDAPEFKFQYNRVTDDGKSEPVQVRLDSEWALLQLRNQCPTAFKVEETTADGPVYGLDIVLRSIETMETVPPHLPTFEHFLGAVKKSLHLPMDFPLRHTIIVLREFLNDMLARVETKKGMPASPSSPEPTQG